MVLLLVIAGWEGAFRIFETRLSADIRHLRSLPALAGRIEDRDARDETTLIVGNSLARRGIDAGLLKAGLEKRTRSEGAVHLEFFVPDGTSVTEWSWGLRRYFRPGEAALKRVIVITGRNHLLDRPGDPEKLGAFFVSKTDLADAMKQIGDEEDAIRLLLGNFSHLAANRGRVRPLIGYRFLPGFEEAWPKLMAVGFEASLERLGESAGRWQLNSLRRLLDQAEQLDAELIVVAVPMPGGYELPEKMRQLLAQRQVPVIDLSEVPGIDRQNFPDGTHLDQDGATKFTGALLERLP